MGATPPGRAAPVASSHVHMSRRPSSPLVSIPRSRSTSARSRLAPTRWVAVLAVAGVLAACGSDDDASTTTVVTDLDLEAVDGPPTDDDPTDGATGESPTDDTAEPDDTGSPDKPTVDVPDAIPSELQITDLTTGNGPEAEVGDIVFVDYVGVVTATGDEFDNSFDRGQPFDVKLGEGRVIAGWDQGLIGVQTGGRRQLDIPAELAYGEAPPPGSVIAAGDALTFVIDVRAVVPAADEDAEPELDLDPSIGRTDLGIDDLVVGEGDELELGDTAIVHLMLLRGDDLEVLESTWRFGEPAAFTLLPDGPIPGLVDGLLGMRTGGLRALALPPSLAFGPEGIPEAGLPADTDVIIVAELLGSY